MAQYNGVTPLKQLAACKVDYKGKNDSGGRKAVFSQSAAYKRSSLDGIAIPWNMDLSHRPVSIPFGPPRGIPATRPAYAYRR